MKRSWALILALVMLIGLMPMQVLASENEENPWEGRSAVFVGDSITAGSGTTKIYYEYLEESLGFGSVTPMGVAGSCISAASDYGQTNQPLINRYQNIPSADLIVVFMGTNDYGHETPLGSVEDTQDGTFYGALNVIIPALVAKHPSSEIVFVTPLHRYGFGTSKILGTQFTSDDVANGVGATLGDYVEALKTVCANNGVSVIDLYTECTLDPADAETRTNYMPDGLHPNAAGHEVIAGIMESYIRGFEPAEQEPVELTEMVYGNRFAPGNNQTCRASSRINYYLKAGTVITLKDSAAMQWACTKTSDETSSSNLGYFPDSGWSDKETAVVEADGWVGFVFKYRDETQVFDLTKPLSDYIIIEEPHTHAYTPTVTVPTCTEQGYTTYTCACGDSYVDDYTDAAGHSYANGICVTCGEVQPMDAFTTTDALVAAIRQAMVQRQSEIQLRLEGIALTSSELSSLIAQARAHTGVPNEGDYIRANMLGYSWSVTTGSDADGVYSIVTITVNFISDADMEVEVDAAVEELLNELDLWDATNYEKVKGVYDWITEHVDYDYPWDDLEDDTTYYKHTTHAALIQKKAVCQGVASLYYRLMLELGVDCRYISGTSTDITGTENHAWNIVYLDGKYYNCDPTWDLGLTDYYRQFLCTESNFEGHTRDAEFDTAQFHADYPMAVTPYVLNVTASGQVNGSIDWVLDGDTGTLTVAGTGAIPSYRYSHAPWYDYRESVKKIVISEGITEVGERAFYWCTNCTEVILPESLTAIREYGFNNLRSLKNITLPSNLKILEFCAFSECVALTSIVLPDSVTTVESNAFSNCYALTSAVLSAGMTTIPSSMFGGDSKLSSVVLPEGITYIDDTAFINCGFKEFTLPASVTGLGTSVFSGCTSLTKFIVEEGNTQYKAVDGVLFSADGTHLICYPAAKTGNYTVPEGTLYIDYGAFRSQKYMYYVYFPSTLIKIDGYAFSYCKNLSRVTFNSNITTIGDDAFRSCTNLKSVTFENPNVTLVGYTFANCTSLRTITLPSNLKEIPNGLFSGCTNLQSITIPSTATKIGSSAFIDCDSLTSITIPGNVKSIGQQAFDFCNKLEEIIFEEGVTTLGWICIRNAPKLKKVVIPSTVTKVEQPSNTDSYLFDDCPNVVLYVSCGSYGYTYAVNHDLTYQVSHTIKTTVVQPTCTEQGYTRYGCSCGANDQRSDYTPALGHEYEEFIIPPTCDWEGYTLYCCIRCAESYCGDYVPPAHSFGEWHVELEPTCTTDGEKWHYCFACGYCEYEVIPATGHNYTSVVTPPTCTEQGYTTCTCSVCGASYVEGYRDATGHSYGEWYTVTEATCTTEGEKRHDCENCDHYEMEVIAAIGHSYASVVTPPTCTEQGYTTYTCACGDSYVDDYTDATGHSHVVTDSKDATCTEDGYTTYACACGDSYTETIEASGHSYVDGACEHCGEADPTAVLMGDVNDDGIINYLDAMLIAQRYVGIIGDEDLNLSAADVNGDGIVNYLDSMMIAQFYVGIIDSFQAEN